ncbi:MAG: hypothetical protein EBQ89_09280 [Alphaproteobacteria bacterium]|nr:hypothetical protein [Alphaproteobacteria bacterium]
MWWLRGGKGNDEKNGRPHAPQGIYPPFIPRRQPCVKEKSVSQKKKRGLCLNVPRGVVGLYPSNWLAELSP